MVNPLLKNIDDKDLDTIKTNCFPDKLTGENIRLYSDQGDQIIALLCRMLGKPNYVVGSKKYQYTRQHAGIIPEGVSAYYLDKLNNTPKNNMRYTIEQLKEAFDCFSCLFTD